MDPKGRGLLAAPASAISTGLAAFHRHTTQFPKNVWVTFSPGPLAGWVSPAVVVGVFTCLRPPLYKVPFYGLMSSQEGTANESWVCAGWGVNGTPMQPFLLWISSSHGWTVHEALHHLWLFL